MPLKCIIVDDESRDVNALRSHIRKTPFLKLAGAFSDPEIALEFLKDHPADLVFLHIRRADRHSKTILPLFHEQAAVILMSADRKLASDGYEAGVSDFMVKPFTFSRFQAVMERLQKPASPSRVSEISGSAPVSRGGYIFIKESTRLLRVELDDIFYVAGLKNYVSVYTKSQRIVSLQTMKQMESILPPHRFARVHRSYFVAFDKIISVEKQQIRLRDKTIPIGNIYYTAFMKKLMKMGNS